MDAAEAVEILERTPGSLRALLGGLSEGWTAARPGESAWSAFDIVGHLIHGERTNWVPRARMILEHGEDRAFERFDREAMFEASRGLTMADLLDTFDELRKESLAEIEALSLDEPALGKRGLHPDLGPVTMGQLLATWAAHDLSHVGQIVEVMAKRYRQEVGPWRASLPTLSRPDDE